MFCVILPTLKKTFKMKRIFAVLLSFLSMSVAVYAQEVRTLADIKLAPAKQFTQTIFETLRTTLANPKIDMTLALYATMFGAPNFDGVSQSDCTRIRIVECNGKTFTFADFNASENSQLVKSLKSFCKIQKSQNVIRAIFTKKEIALPQIEKLTKPNAFFEIEADAQYLVKSGFFPLPKTLKNILLEADKIKATANLDNNKLTANILIFPQENSKLQKQLTSAKLGKNLVNALPKSNFIEIISTFDFDEKIEFSIPQNKEKNFIVKTNSSFAIVANLEKNALTTSGVFSIIADTTTNETDIVFDNKKYYIANSKDFLAFATTPYNTAKILSFAQQTKADKNQAPKISITIKPDIFENKIANASILAQVKNKTCEINIDMPFEYLGLFLKIAIQSDFVKKSEIGGFVK